MENELSSPLDICVLIPCHNNREGLIDSINSIKYDYQRLRVLVVDDGSLTAITGETIQPFLLSPIHVDIVRLEQNQGIVKALNTGLEFIHANYVVGFIARLDCGDICTPDRFYKQLAFLQKNPGIDLLGTWCYFKNMQTGLSYKYETPTVHEEIVDDMYFRNVFVHPTVMWRVAALGSYRYPEIYPHAEDYGLFYDIVVAKRTAILDEFLVTCEINKKGISFLNRSVQLKSRLRVIWDFGTSKWRLMVGTAKLGVLMALPYQLIYRLKNQLYSNKP